MALIYANPALRITPKGSLGSGKRRVRARVLMTSLSETVMISTLASVPQTCLTAKSLS